MSDYQRLQQYLYEMPPKSTADSFYIYTADYLDGIIYQYNNNQRPIIVESPQSLSYNKLVQKVNGFFTYVKRQHYNFDAGHTEEVNDLATNQFNRTYTTAEKSQYKPVIPSTNPPLNSQIEILNQDIEIMNDYVVNSNYITTKSETLKELNQEVSKEYTLFIIWLIIAIIIVIITILTVLNDNELHPVVLYICLAFIFYCIYYIFKNIYYII